MTLEELEFMLKHPEMTEKSVVAYFAALKPQQTVAEEARRAAERGVVTRAIPIR